VFLLHQRLHHNQLLVFKPLRCLQHHLRLQHNNVLFVILVLVPLGQGLLFHSIVVYDISHRPLFFTTVNGVIVVDMIATAIDRRVSTRIDIVSSLDRAPIAIAQPRQASRRYHSRCQRRRPHRCVPNALNANVGLAGLAPISGATAVATIAAVGAPIAIPMACACSTVWSTRSVRDFLQRRQCLKLPHIHQCRRSPQHQR
jgi:hypothetical protein